MKKDAEREYTHVNETPGGRPPAKVKLRNSTYDYDTNAASDHTGLACADPTLAQQQFAEESDINYIADRYGLTGAVPQVLDLPKQGDFTGIYSFQDAMDSIILAQRQFMTLPAKVRSRFANDPQQLIDFLEDDKNREEAEFLGLVKKRPPVVLQDDPGNAGGAAGGGTLPSQAKPPAEPPAGKPDKKAKDT